MVRYHPYTSRKPEQHFATDGGHNIGISTLHNGVKYADGFPSLPRVWLTRFVPGTIASKFLTERIDRKIVRVGNGQIPKLQRRDCFVLRALAQRIVHPALETSSCLSSHEDLAPQNIIIDSGYNIRG